MAERARPPFRQKTDEELAIQIEHFGGSLNEYNDKSVVLDNIGTLKEVRSPSNLNDKQRPIVEKLGRKYVGWLRRRSGEDKEKLSQIKENTENYKQFKPTVDQLKKEVQELDIWAKAEEARILSQATYNGQDMWGRAKIDEKSRSAISELQSRKYLSQLEGYLGAGSNGVAVRRVINGKEYAIKIDRGGYTTNYEAQPLLAVRGMKNVCQLVAYSVEESVKIMEVLPGAPMDAPLEKGQQTPITDTQVEKLVETTFELLNRGIALDPKASNFLLDEQNGISILDFHLRDPKLGRPPEADIFDLTNPLRARLLQENPPAKYFQTEAEAIIRILRVVKDKFPDHFEKLGTVTAEMVEIKFKSDEPDHKVNFFKKLKEEFDLEITEKN